MNRFFLLIAAAIISLSSFAASSPKREFRSTWLTTYQRIDWPSNSAVGNPDKCKQELIDYLDMHADRNYTGVCLHVRCWADAVYKSSYEPWSEFVSGTRGKDPGWDPLAFAVEECHKRGLECYAWINPFRFSRNNAPRTTPRDLEILAKGWIIDNGTVTDHNEYQVFNPALPEVRQYLYNIFREIYTNYRIDGMLFDDYFYPNGIPADRTAQDFVDFQAQNPGKTGTDKEIRDWRRGNINLFMRELYTMIQNDRPDMRFGLSPAGIAKHGCANVDGIDPIDFGTDWQYDDINSDPVAWLNDGSIDFISPQIYWFANPGSNSYTPAGDYTKLCEWWSMAADHFGRHFYSSMGPYRMADNYGNPIYNNETHWKDLSKQISLNRQFSRNNAPGAIMYSAKYMDGPLCSGWGEYLERHSFQSKSLIPVVDWKEHAPLARPQVTRSGNTLSWGNGSAAPAAYDPIRRHTLYAIPAYLPLERALDAGGDGIDAQYLLQVVYGDSFELPAKYSQNYWFAVCEYDGYGFESEAAIVDYPDEFPEIVTTRDETDYPASGSFNVTNVWFRSTHQPFGNIDFDESGKLNRGMVIAGDKVLVTGRYETSAGPSYLREYDLTSGEYVRDIDIDIPAEVSYPCNDIIRDGKGNIYLTNLVVNIKSKPLTLYRLDPTTGQTTLFASVTGDGISERSARVDHCGIEALDNGTFYVYAAIANNSTIVRWTLDANGNVNKTETCKVKNFIPSSAGNFGVAPKAFPIGNGRVVIDGGSTHPTEYNFTTGEISGSLADAVLPEGTQSNGFVHFGPSECFMAYSSADHSAADGYKFNIVRADSHNMASAGLMWKLPQIAMGNVSSTTMSAPVDAVTKVDGNNWSSHVAMYTPGNSLAVYRIDGKNVSSAISPNGISETISYTVIGNRVHFDRLVGSASVFDLSGRQLSASAGVSSIALPSASGVYIVRFDGSAARVVVR